MRTRGRGTREGAAGGVAIGLVPGTAGAAEINAAILAASLAGGGVVIVEPGEVELDTAIIGQSNVRLLARYPGATRLVWTGDAPDVGDADDPENAAIRVVGTVGAISTTLAAVAPMTSRKVTVTSATGITAGKVLRIQGHNGPPGYPNDMNGMSDADAVVLTEYCEVAPAGVAGAVLTLTCPLSQHHMTGLAVVDVVPVDGFVIDGFDLAFDGGTHAVGILVDIARGVEIRNCSGAGFSRAMIELRSGVSDFVIEGVHGRGENNSLVMMTSTMRGRILDLSNSSTGLRRHVNGIPRALLNTRSRCTHIYADGLDLPHGCVGFRWFGGVDSFYRGRIRDCDSTGVAAADPEIGTPGVTVGSAIDGGPASTAPVTGIAEFARGLTLDFDISDCNQEDDSTACTVYFHDGFEMTLRAKIRNAGPSDGTALDGITRHMTGVIASDVTGHILQLDCHGILRGYTIRGSANVEVTAYAISGLPGNGTPVAYPMYIPNAGSAGAWGKWRSVRMSDVTTTLLFETASQNAPDWQFAFDFFQNPQYDYHYTNVKIARLPTGAPAVVGDVVRLISGTSGERHVEYSSAPDIGCGVVAAGNTNATLILVAFGDGVATCTEDAVAVGDFLVASSVAKQAEAAADPAAAWAAGHVFGIATSNKAAGAPGSSGQVYFTKP